MTASYRSISSISWMCSPGTETDAYGASHVNGSVLPLRQALTRLVKADRKRERRQLRDLKVLSRVYHSEQELAFLVGLERDELHVERKICPERGGLRQKRAYHGREDLLMLVPLGPFDVHRHIHDQSLADPPCQQRGHPGPLSRRIGMDAGKGVAFCG